MKVKAGRPAIIGLLVVAALTAAGIAVRALSPDRTPLPYNVVLVSIDTLRADHLGCYGYGPPTSAHVDAFRRDAVLFRQAISQAPSTLASHASMLTSLLPIHHGGSFGDGRRVAREVVTLAEVLADAGYATVSFNNGGQLVAAYGLDQGFDRYVEIADARTSTVVESTLAWLDERPAEPFFLFFHSYEVHHPYTPREKHLRLFESPYAGKLPPRHTSIDLLRRINDGEVRLEKGDLEHVVATYDAEIFTMDGAFGWLIEELQARGLYDDTLIVFTSDHGEEFGEHGGVGKHSHTLYDELLRVPLLVKLPGGAAAGSTVDVQVPLLDLAPTVLAVLDLSPPRSWDGESLLPLVPGAGRRGSAEDRPAVSQLDTGNLFSLRTPRWKLIRHALYDLDTDPAERWDVSAFEPEIAERMEEERRRWLERRDPPPPEAAEPDDETRDRLKALGYLG